MKHRKLFMHVYIPHMAVLLMTLLVAGSWALRGARREHYTQTRHSLRAAALMLTETLARLPDPRADPDSVDALCKAKGEATGYRFTVVRNSGRVVGDSHEDPLAMGDHSGRPEIRMLIGEPADAVGWSERRSETVRMNMVYVAVPWQGDAERIGFVRAARPMGDVDLAIARQRIRIAGVGLWLAALGALVSAWIAGRLSEPLQRMRQQVQAYSIGRSGLHLPSSPILEIHTLTEAMNRMASHLDESVQTIVRQRDEQNALFSCMTEAVIAVDDQSRILSMNPAAHTLFRPGHGSDADEVVGRPLPEVVRNADVQRLLRKALDRPDPIEEDFDIPDSHRSLQAHGTALTDGHGHRTGAVLVIKDITRLRRLEAMRSAFVANVSHELKTPVTSIKGFAETLLDGAHEAPQERLRFLAIIDRQADRLKSILEDLLALSSLEHDAEKGAIPFYSARLAPLLDHAIQVWHSAAEKKGMTFSVACDADLKAVVNAPLLEQAVVNLIGNAVKYGLERTEISVSAERIGTAVQVRVADQGPGIARQHLSRLFERFYRVDKGRSRSMGGTGLGLAIVKRVALAHGGNVAVESRIGEGSIFTLTLPDRPA